MSLPQGHQKSINVVFSDAANNEINKTHFQRVDLNMLTIFREISNSDIAKHINTVEYPGTVQ
jgi:hypothetical protein